MKKLLVFMLAVLIAVTSPEQFKMNSICPHQYRLCFYTAWRLCRKGRANNLLKTRCTRTVFFYACPV